MGFVQMSKTYHPLSQDMRHVMVHTEGLWDELRGQGVFVTGGTGFVGRWLLESLLWANDRLSLRLRVVVLSRRPDAFARLSPQLAGHPTITLLRGDCRTFDYPDGEYSHVLHLAKESEPAASAPGTARVLEFAESHSTTELLFTSSGAVYGRQPEDRERLTEDFAGVPSLEDPHAEYALGKRAGEDLCAAAAGSRVHAKIARCFTFVGPYMDFDAGYAIGNFIRDAIRADAVQVSGDGTALRSYLYAADLAVWLWTILFAGEDAVPYNVGSPDPVSIGDTACLVARVAGEGKPVRITGTAGLHPTPPERYVPDTSRAAHLGLRVEIGLEEAVRRTASWYRSTL